MNSRKKKYKIRIINNFKLMGNFFKKIPTDKFDESLISFLKTKKL